MQHITKRRGEPDLTSGLWEPCIVFVADENGGEICAGCGWLHEEHADQRR